MTDKQNVRVFGYKTSSYQRMILAVYIIPEFPTYPL